MKNRKLAWVTPKLNPDGTHPADGLYCLNYRRVNQLDACFEHSNAWLKRHGHGDVPITYRDMITQQVGRTTSAVRWLLRRMRSHHRITEDEWDRASYAYSNRPISDAKVLMDTLYNRAIREGRLHG